MLAILSGALTGTRIEAEYRAARAALARVAPPASSFDARSYDPAAVARARAHWSKRMIDEYTSTTVFSSLAAQLVEANATLDASAVALRMAHDELVHAEACSRVVSAMGGAARALRETDVTAIARHPGCSAEERALRNVIFTTCISEMNSISFLITSLDRLADPYLCDVTRQLLSDEVLHGSFGFAYLEAWTPYLDEHPEVRASVARYLRFGFAVAEREFARDYPTVRALAPDEAALGVVDAGEAAEVFRATMTDAVVPGLERFGIDAADAWTRRSLG